jgi:hypothetical protein
VVIVNELRKSDDFVVSGTDLESYHEYQARMGELKVSEAAQTRKPLRRLTSPSAQPVSKFNFDRKRS